MSPTPVGPYYPTSALVAVAWLRQRVTGISAGQVATKLPRDMTTWSDEGFVQATVISGSPDVDIPVRRALVQVDCWAVALDAGGNVTTSPPVAKATRLAELIMDIVTRPEMQQYGREVTMPANYLPARVLSVYPLTEPAEVPDDPSSFARVTLDLAIDWARVV